MGSYAVVLLRALRADPQALASPPLEAACGWGPGLPAAHSPVHCELPVLLHGHGHPVQGACVVGWVNGSQREHAPLAAPETKEHVVTL